MKNSILVVLMTSLYFSCALQEEDPIISSRQDSDSTDIVPVIPETCSTMTVRIWEKDTIFSWVEWFADGHLDTLFRTSRGWYPTLQKQSLIMSPIPVIRPVKDTLVCPGDSLWVDPSEPIEIVAGEALPANYSWKPGGVDTVYLNYSADSLYPMVRPSVQLLNKDSILLALDTLEFTGDVSNSSRVDYRLSSGDQLQALNVDSSVVNLVSSNVIHQGSTCGINPCEYFAQPDSLQNCLGMIAIITPSHPTYNSYMQLQNNVQADTEPGVYTWTLRIKTRLGYTDSLVGQTVVLDWRDRCQE